MGLKDIILPNGDIWKYERQPDIPILAKKRELNIKCEESEFYQLFNKRNTITAKKRWNPDLIDLTIEFASKNYQEKVIIKKGKIIDVISLLVFQDVPLKIDGSKITKKELQEIVRQGFEPPMPTPKPQYIKIKEYEEELGYLPWLQELIPIFQGNGYFK